MTYRVRNIGIAVILAAFAGLLTIFYVANYKRNVQHEETKVSVLVAARDIPAGTAGSEVVGQHMLTTEDVARRAIVPGAISSSDQLQRLIATQQIFAGEQVTTRRFGARTEQGIRSLIRGNERAFQLPGDSDQLLAGTLKEGDHVDLVANWQYPESAQSHVSRVVLRNLLVLQAADPGAASTKLAGGPNAPLYVQLRVSDSQSQKLLWIEKNGDFQLELRPGVNSADSPNSVESGGTMLRDGLRRSP